jgi:CRP-like cAMP-binding protein
MGMIDSAQLKALGKVSFFEGGDAGRLTDLLPYLDKESFRKGELIIRTGSQGDKVYFLVSGKVKVRKMLLMNLDYLGYKPIDIVEDLGTFDPGYHFGEMALVGNRERSADVIAEEDCELFSISKESFDRIVRDMPEIGQKMLLAFCNTLATWIRTYDKKLIENVQNRTLIQLLTAEKKKSVAMHRITRSTVFSTVGQVFDTILEACMDCLGVEKGSLMIFKEGDLRVEAAFGLDKFEISGRVQEIKESSVSGRCFMSGQALLVEDIRKVEGLKGAGDGSKYFNPSLLSVPLVSLKGETLGVVNVNNKTSRERFTEDDKVMLQELAQEAGAVLGYEIDLARLFYEMEDTYIQLRQTREPLTMLEDRISRVLGGAWPKGVTIKDGRQGRE